MWCLCTEARSIREIKQKQNSLNNDRHSSLYHINRIGVEMYLVTSIIKKLEAESPCI